MFGVGRDLCGSSGPIPLPKQGRPEQAAEDLVQAGLEYLQRRRFHNLPGQPVPGLPHPQREEVLPHVQLELPLLQFVDDSLQPMKGSSAPRMGEAGGPWEQGSRPLPPSDVCDPASGGSRPNAQLSVPSRVAPRPDRLFHHDTATGLYHPSIFPTKSPRSSPTPCAWFARLRLETPWGPEEGTPPPTAATLCCCLRCFLIKSRDRADAARNKSSTTTAIKTTRWPQLGPCEHGTSSRAATAPSRTGWRGQLLCHAWTPQVVTKEMVTWLYQERKNGCGHSQPGQLRAPIPPGKSDQGLWLSLGYPARG